MNTKFESFSVYFKIEEKPISKNFKMDNGLVVFFPKNVLFFFLCSIHGCNTLFLLDHGAEIDCSVIE